MLFLEFSKAVFGHWESLMFGAVAAGLMLPLSWLWGKWTGSKELPWYVYAWMTIIFCFVGSYQAWVDKYDELKTAVNEAMELKEKLKSMKPKLKAGFYNAYWIPEYPLLIVLAHIGNTGTVPSVVHDFELTIGGRMVRPVTDKQQSTGAIHIRLGLAPNMIDMVLLGDEFLEHRTMITPIEQGKLVRGWLLFDLSNVTEKCQRHRWRR